MTTERRSGSRTIAVLLAIALVQVFIQLSFAAPAAVPQQFVARITTSGNQPVTINGASASSGASLLTGATIETPAAVSATIDLGALGTIELQPNSSVQLDFDNDGNVRLKVLRGCVVMKKNGKGVGEVYTAEGSSEKSTSGKKMAFCFANGGLSPLGQAAAATAGASGEGIGTAALVAILAGGGALVAGLVWAFHGGGNPSPR
jgi:hypothetical protein